LAAGICFASGFEELTFGARPGDASSAESVIASFETMAKNPGFLIALYFWLTLFQH